MSKNSTSVSLKGFGDMKTGAILCMTQHQEQNCGPGLKKAPKSKQFLYCVFLQTERRFLWHQSSPLSVAISALTKLFYGVFYHSYPVFPAVDPENAYIWYRIMLI
jgi:hypothetical protein